MEFEVTARRVGIDACVSIVATNSLLEGNDSAYYPSNETSRFEGRVEKCA